MSKKIAFLYQGGSSLGLGHFYYNALCKKGYESKVFYYHLDHLSQRLGRFDFLFSFISNRVKINMESIIDFQPDVIVVMKGDFLNVSTLQQIKEKTNAKLWNIYSDHPLASLKSRVMKFIPALEQYDLVWTFSETLIPIFYQIGAKNVKSIPFAHDPSIHYPVINTDDVYNADIAYLGSWGPFQEKWLQKFSNYNLKIYGGGWKRSRNINKLYKCWMEGLGYGEDMKKAIAGSKMVFNLVRAEHCALHSMKTFELVACGGCVISNRTPEQEKFFTDGKDIIFFDNTSELESKVNFYLKNEEKRSEIVKNALETIKEHTYLKRIEFFIKEFN